MENDNLVARKTAQTDATKPVPISDSMAKEFSSGIMLIPTALEVDAMIRKIPRGQVCYAG